MSVKLVDICDIQYGYPFDSAFFSEADGVPLVRIRDVIRGYSETRTTEKFPDGYIVSDGDILIGMDGEFNIAKWHGGRAALNQRVCRLIPRKVDQDYIFYFMPSALKRIGEKTPFATVRHLSVKELNKIVLELPSAEEQRRIASILNRLSVVIAQRQRQLLVLGTLVKARFVEMFGDPIINDRGWQQITLLESLEAGRTVTYGIVQTGDDFEGGTPVFRPIDIAGGHVPKREELKKTDPLISAQYKRTVLKGKELLITVRGSVGETFQTTEEFEGCNVGRNIVPLVTDSNKVLQRFLQALFAQDAIKHWLKGITKGIALQGFNMGELKEMPVIIPPIPMQKAFVDFALQADKSKAVVRKALDEAQLLFDSLMQKYFG